MKNAHGSGVRKFVISAAISIASIGLVGSSVAEAGTGCSSGGTCLRNPADYTTTPVYRNTVGKIANLGTVGWSNVASSVSDSTSSSSFQGVTFYNSTGCSNATGTLYISRGSQALASSSSNWNNNIESFRLIRSDGTAPTC